jgi:hypothetical protein
MIELVVLAGAISLECRAEAQCVSREMQFGFKKQHRGHGTPHFGRQLALRSRGQVCCGWRQATAGRGGSTRGMWSDEGVVSPTETLALKGGMCFRYHARRRWRSGGVVIVAQAVVAVAATEEDFGKRGRY